MTTAALAPLAVRGPAAPALQPGGRPAAGAGPAVRRRRRHQPALPGRAQPRDHLPGQRLHRRGRDRHVDGDRLGQHRRLGGLADRRARRALGLDRGRGLADLAELAGPVLAGMAVNGFMGFLVAWLNIPSIVVTLGFLSILKGGLIMATGGAWIANLPPGYALAQMEPLGIAMPIWFMVVLTAAAALVDALQRPRAQHLRGRRHAEAARLAGIDRRRVILQVFLIHGAFAGIASVLFATQLSVIQSTVPPISSSPSSLPRSWAASLWAASARSWLDPGRHPDRRHRQLADLPQCLALLDPRGAGRADPRHRARRPAAPPPAGAALMAATTAPRPGRAPFRLGQEAVLAPSWPSPWSWPSPASSSSPSTTCSTRAGSPARSAWSPCR